jgi:hypothetical protein
MVRYADDFVVLCARNAQAQGALEEVRAWMNANGLELHPDKTRIGDCRMAGQGFELPSLSLRSGAAVGAAQEPQRTARRHSPMHLARAGKLD